MDKLVKVTVDNMGEVLEDLRKRLDVLEEEDQRAKELEKSYPTRYRVVEKTDDHSHRR